MKQASTLFLKIAIALITLGVLAFCGFILPVGILAEDVGGYRPILQGLYLPAIPFFIAMYQIMKLLNLIDKNKAFSELAVKALKNVKWCGIAISGFFVAGLPYIYIVADSDDAPGVILIALIIIGASLVVGTFAGVFQQLFQNAIEIKSENDLTV